MEPFPEASEQLARAARELESRRYAEAVAIYEALPPESMTVGAASNLGLALFALGRLDEAKRWLDLARRQSDDPRLRRLRLNLANAFLTAGRYPEGFELWEERIGLDPNVPVMDLGSPEWRGESLDGKSILVWHEQGFGDQIMMARFFRDLAARGAHVTVTCRPALAELLGTAEGLAQVIPVPFGQSVALPIRDYWVRIFSLPHRLQISPSDAFKAPYLRAPIIAGEKGRRGMIGMAWRTDPESPTASIRSLPFEAADGLLSRGVISLDPESTGARTFSETAALVDELSLVITVDTAMAHLAGALGTPVWVLLPNMPDWRWAQKPSPWYPNARTFRQSSPGDWASVMMEVHDELERREGP